MRCSVESARGFIRLFLGLRDTPFCYHQTLTFQGEIVTDRTKARAQLNRLLNVLHKQFDVVSLWSEEGYSKRRIHYHVAFLFYPDPPQPTPDALRRNFGAEVFRHWYRITGGTVKRVANKITLWKKGIDLLAYIIGEAVPCDTVREKGKLLWHGSRNAKLIAAHSSPVSKREIRAVFKKCFAYLDFYKPVKLPYNEWTKHGPQYYDKATLRELRATVEARGEIWRKFKDGQTGVKNCPDRDYMEWLNQKIELDENTL